MINTLQKHLTPARLAVGLVAAIYIGFLAYPDPRWRNSSPGAWDYSGVCILLAGPLIAALAAWRVRTVLRLMQSGAWSRSSPVKATIIEVGVLAALFVAMHLFFTAAALAYAAVSGTEITLRGAPVLLTQVLAIVAAATIGGAAAATIRSPLTAPVLALVLFLVPVFGYQRVPKTLLLLGGATGIPIQFEPSQDYVRLQATFALGVIIACLAMLPSGWRRKPLTALVIVAFGVAAAGPATARLVSDPPVRFVPSGTWAMTCDNNRPGLCLHKDSERLRGQLRAYINKELAILDQLGVTKAPERYEQVRPGIDNPEAQYASTRLLDVPENAVVEPGASRIGGDMNLLMSIAGPKVCLDDNRLPGRYAESVMTALAWMRLQMGDEAARTQPDVAKVLAAGPSGIVWLKATFTGFADCDENAIPEPLE